ncbi:MAG: hypothetical protein ABJF10_11525 [Chthoniobacter sp.]|uniref:hypothetical protein n=1 Tax=Chthoniobacter sp. TaxID=2510640 RepID=UPI0032A1DCEE
MNRLASLFLIAETLHFGSIQAAEQRVQDFVLDYHTVYTVPVSGMRVTTISFPSPIAAIDGALTTADGKTPGVFQIAHTKGTAYFSARALAKGATTNLNVRWNNRTYVFDLHESAEPCYSLVLRGGSEKSSALTRPLTPNRLLGLLDKAKAFALLQQYQPDVVRDVEYRDCRAKPLVTDCGDYEVRLTEAFRFPEQDTLVFQLSVANKSGKPLEHQPERLEVRVGEQVFTPSLSDLSSIIAPHGGATGYVAITGNPSGRRNGLSIKNDFTFVLSRRDAAMEAATRGFDELPTTGLSK